MRRSRTRAQLPIGPQAESASVLFAAVKLHALRARAERSRDLVGSKRRQLKMRSERSYCVRQCVAWLVNVLTMLVCFSMIRIYANNFGETATSQLMSGWALSLGTACGSHG